MTETSTRFSELSLEKYYPASPARVFDAWASPEAMQAWAAPAERFTLSFEAFEFREGGAVKSSFGAEGQPAIVNDERYVDIRPAERIIIANEMRHEGILIFAGLLTVTFGPDGEGCRMVVTEQGVFLDGHDKPENHEAGWGAMLDKLGASLE